MTVFNSSDPDQLKQMQTSEILRCLTHPDSFAYFAFGGRYFNSTLDDQTIRRRIYDLAWTALKEELDARIPPRA